VSFDVAQRLLDGSVVAGRSLGDAPDSWRPLRDEALDSLGVSELGMYLLSEFGLDLFEADAFAAFQGLTLREIFERTGATRAAAAR
jgi:hypothetical protein